MTLKNSTTSTSAWWYCISCGFKNKPRHYGDQDRCEQCGHAAEDPKNIAYKPEGA